MWIVACLEDGSLMTRRWRKTDSNPRSLSRECHLILAEEKGLRVDQVVKKGAIIL